MRNELFRRVFAGDDVDVEFALEKATQPDLFFTSKAEVVGIEMKVDAKCDLRQVLKYALLGLAVELQTGEPRQHYLALLGRSDFARQWHERFASVDELKLALASTDVSSFLNTQANRHREHEQRFREIVASTVFSFINYAELAAFLADARPPDADETPSAEVFRKLVDGMIAELRRRGLTL